MKKYNFLLGKGERLTEQVRVLGGPVVKNSPYTFDQAQQRLAPMLAEVNAEIDNIPTSACPDDLAIATITLNPEYIAKSYHPSELLRTIGLETVGSRARKIKPERKSRDREPEEAITTEYFVMGKRAAFKKWSTEFNNWNEFTPGVQQIIEIEEISFPSAENKIKSTEKKSKNVVYEIVLHLDEESAENRYLGLFKNYLKGLNLSPTFERRFYAGGLCFIEMEAPSNLAKEIAEFSLVRVIRKMPSLRLLRPAFRSNGIDNTLKIVLPDVDVLDSKIKVAIFDGGIPQTHPITRWANAIDAAGIGPEEAELLEHGVGVTSAFLFGHIDPKVSLPRPYCSLDHYRVLDNMPGQNPYELYEVLDRISNILTTKNYDFVNLSLGPRLPIDDDEIHAWTAVLDEHFSNGKTLATIAVGNDGEGDALIGANRIQVPADCVNALGIGACDVPDSDWLRAPYSSIGPGRNPGIMKPDLVDFGGSVQRPFLTLDSDTGLRLLPTGGTSFAAPSVLRIASGVRTHFGNALNALAIRTLLVHCSEESDIPTIEVGWGRVSRSLEEIVTCDDHVMRVVYQGELSASKYIRATIPLPSGVLSGMVTIKATLCYATSVDPHHPGNYTRSGLDLIFRPNKDSRKETTQLHPNSKPFFSKSQKHQTEEELRRDAWKWENCQHANGRFQGKSLNEPTFDIHYNARLDGHNDTRSQKIQYALVITVEAPRIKDLYDQVVRRYATQLEALQPLIDIPIKVR